jgi:hypothetical protein
MASVVYLQVLNSGRAASSLVAGFSGPDFGALAARQGAAFSLLPIGCADLHQLRLGGNGLGYVSIHLGLIARRGGTLCGIRATGKYFLLARHCRASRLRRCGYRTRSIEDSCDFF